MIPDHIIEDNLLWLAQRPAGVGDAEVERIGEWLHGAELNAMLSDMLGSGLIYIAWPDGEDCPRFSLTEKGRKHAEALEGRTPEPFLPRPAAGTGRREPVVHPRYERDRGGLRADPGQEER